MKQNIYDNPTFFNKYKALRDSGITYNDFIEQPAIKALLPNLEGKTILDLGCGSGLFAKFCIENGAKKVVGVDISKNMIELAKQENNHENITYICSPFEDFETENNQFDVVISSLAIHYIKDYKALTAKIYRFLKQNGEFIFSTEHPFVTARKEGNNWIRDEEGNRLYYAIDNYQEEGVREHQWFVKGVIVYHRTFSTLVNTLIENGFSIEKIVEPESTKEGLEKMPNLVNESRKPTFLLIKSKKY